MIRWRFVSLFFEADELVERVKRLPWRWLASVRSGTRHRGWQSNGPFFLFCVCVCFYVHLPFTAFPKCFRCPFSVSFFSRGLLVSVSEASIWSTDKSRPEQLMTGAVSALDMEEKKWRTPRTSYFVPPSISLDLILRMCILGHRRDTRCVLEWTR